MSWHEISCRRPDLVSVDGIQSCLRCGSFKTSIRCSPLPPVNQQSEIRILYLNPGGLDDDIHCEIHTHDLIDKPEYEAISYTWADEDGDATPCRTVFISRNPINVTRNCEMALKRVRHTKVVRKIWIDAVCIDQNNVSERGVQVQLMPDIYRGAKAVLVYIGEATATSRLCLDRFSNFYPGMISHNPHAEELLSRRYFGRVWVLQEVALANSLVMICGDQIMAWPFYKLDSNTSNSPVVSFSYSLPFSAEGLLTLLDVARNCDATDPRDKVFSLVGLMRASLSDFIKPNYNVSVVEIYTKTALNLVAHFGWKAVVRRAGTKNRRIDALPSWVPDWSCPLKVARFRPERAPDIADRTIKYAENGDILLPVVRLPGNSDYEYLLAPSKTSPLDNTFLLLKDGPVAQRLLNNRQLAKYGRVNSHIALDRISQSTYSLAGISPSTSRWLIIAEADISSFDFGTGPKNFFGFLEDMQSELSLWGKMVAPSPMIKSVQQYVMQVLGFQEKRGEDPDLELYNELQLVHQALEPALHQLEFKWPLPGKSDDVDLGIVMIGICWRLFIRAFLWEARAHIEFIGLETNRLNV